MQLKSLAKFYYILVEFKDITKVLEEFECKNKDLEISQLKAMEWLESYVNCKKIFSREKFLFPKKIRESYDNAIQNFSSLYTVVKINNEIEKLHYIDKMGNKEL